MAFGRSGSAIHRCAIEVFGLLSGMPCSRELRERRCETLGIARRHRARGIGEVFALPRDGRLHRAGEKRRDDRRDESEDHQEQLRLAVAAAPAAAEEGDAQRDVGEDADRDDEPEDDERDADVVVADVPELVCRARLRARDPS